MRSIRMASIASVVAVVGSLVSPLAPAQNWPSRPVQVLVGYSPGGGGDILTRAFATELSKNLGQSFIVENRPGANGSLALNAVAKAPPDGSMIGFFIPSNVIDALTKKDLPFDLQKDIAPVVMFVTNPLLLTVHPDIPANTLKEFIDMAKAQPGKINVGSPGRGSTNELLQELINVKAGISLTQVAYKGGAPEMAAILAKEVHGGWVSPTQSLPLINAGKLRPLAISTTQRLPSLPNIPAVAESLPGVAADVWFAFGMRAGTPAAIINRLNAEVNRINKTPEMTERINKLGAIQLYNTPDEFGAFMKAEFEKWGSLLKQVPIKLE